MNTSLAIGTAQGVYVLREDGTDWKLVGQGMSGRSVTCVTVAPDGSWWAGSAANGLARSTDGGATWSALSNNLSGHAIYSLAFHPAQAGCLLVGTSPAALHLSLDNGASFSELNALRAHPGADNWSYPSAPYRSRLSRLFLHPGDPNVLLAAVCTGGIYLSGDVGSSWHERQGSAGRAVTELLLHAQAPSRLVAGTPIGCFVSDNLGESWEERNSGLPATYVSAGVAFPDHPDVLFLAVHRNAAGGGSVYRSSDAGKRWEPCAGLPYAPDMAFTSLACSSGCLVAGSNRGELFASRDLGTTWGKIRSAMPAVQCVSLSASA